MNRLLERQIRKFLGSIDAVPEKLKIFFESVSETYDGFDVNRELMERAFDLSSRELMTVAEQLRGAKIFNEEVISQAAEGIIVYDRELRYVHWNSFMERLSGVHAADILGRYALDIFPHLHTTGIDALLERALHGETTTRDIHIEIAEKGISHWITGTYAPHRNATGDIVGVIVTVRDITENKQAEAAIRKSEEKYRAIFESSPEAIVLLDMEGNVIEVNGRMQEWLLFDKSAIIGKNILELPILSEDDRKTAAAVFRKRMQGIEMPPYVLNFLTANGETQVGYVLGRVLYDDHGKPKGSIAMLMNVTELDKMKRQLEESESRYQDLYDSAPIAYFTVGLNGVILAANKAAGEFLGYTAEELVGKSTYDIYANESKERARNLFEMFKEGVSWEGEELTYLRKDGSTVCGLMSVSPLRNADGRVVENRIIVSDITSLKQTQRELAERMQELEEFNRTAVGRELKMIELKEEVNRLLAERGEKKKYEIVM